MIRVAFLLPHLRAGGAERCVVNWIGALDRARYHPVLMLNHVEGEFLSLLPADVMPLSMGGGRAALLPRRISRMLAVEAIDVAYSATNAMNLALLAARTDTRRIVSEHTPSAAYLAEAKLSWARRFAMRRFYPRAEAIAVPTDRIGADLESVLGLRLPVVTLPNPVVADSVVTQATRVPGSTLRLLSAGRLVSAKGFDTLIDACAIVREAGLDFRLDVRGEGPLREMLAARVAERALTRHIAISGYGDLSEAMRDSDLFVLASRREGFGNVLIEAMAAGVPVLATRAGGPETFIADGANGWLVEADDPNALAQAIVRFADVAVRDRTIAAGMATARGYGVAASTTALAGLLDRVGSRLRT